jgi:dihydrofolate synthase/folylpolyglutamate synthase
MQRLGTGPLTDRLPPTSELWLDGAHNPSAAKPVAKALRNLAKGRPVALVTGMLANKDATGVLAALSPSIAQVVAVPVPGHDHHAPETLAAIARDLGLAGDIATDIPHALDRASACPLLLIAGSLYLAGEALALNDEPPT